MINISPSSYSVSEDDGRVSVTITSSIPGLPSGYIELYTVPITAVGECSLLTCFDVRSWSRVTDGLSSHRLSLRLPWLILLGICITTT